MQTADGTAMKLEKRNTFLNDVIFVDGLWGTGKSLLGPIVSGMAGVERVKIESIYEYISWLFHLGEISEEGALWMLRTYADCSQYHNTISREVNLRWRDDTGLGNATDKLKIIRRLFGGEGDAKVEEINRKNLAFCTMSHMLMLAPELLTPAYGRRVKIIEMVRHPLYMVSHFSSYLKRFESPREFTMAFYHEDVKVPWFAKGWEADYVHANATERAVLCITRLYSWLAANLEKSHATGLAVLDLSFEDAVFDTNKTLSRLEQFLGRSHHPSIASILRKQMLPRESIAKGKGHANYGWSTIDKSEGEIYADVLTVVCENCSTTLQGEMNRTIDWYNNKYPNRLSQYQE